MDNVYLFRGKRLDNGEWAQGYYVPQTDPFLPGVSYHKITWQEKINGVLYEKWAKIDIDTIGQCTGLIAAKSYRGESERDRLFFVGDILSFSHPYKNRTGIYEVVHESYKFNCKNFYQPHFDCPSDAFSEGTQYFEIIGTAHDKTEV